MPTSYLDNIPATIRGVWAVKPRSILDIGIGYGKYGLLCREYCERLERIDGVEVWEPYVRSIQRAIYDHIAIGDVRQLPDDDLAGYDLYLMVDVIEHFEKAEGKALLDRLLGFGGAVLVNTPIVDYRAHYENPYEDHQSHWTIGDFRDYQFEDFTTGLGTIVVIRGRRRG